jgi:enamine deaminase RidA (YjgF/YER057c/UK114 family)
MAAEDRLAELGIELPSPPHPVATYVRAVRSGGLLFVSGHGPTRADGTVVTGRVDADLSVEQAQQAARLTALNLLATVQAELGSLNHVRRIVKVLGMVNCSPGFNSTPQVIDGCSNFLVDIFGARVGMHARSAVGMAELPFNIPVEIEMIVEVT